MNERLAEREREMAALAGGAADACAGHGRLIVVAGAAGAGKTSLLEQAARIPELAPLRATAHELEEDFAFGVVRQLFERHVHAAGELGTGEGLLAGAARLAAPALGLDEDPVAARPTYGLMHGLYWVVANLASEHPLMLVIDDLHWADAASLLFFAYLARRISDLPVLMVVGVRTGDPAADRPEVADLLAESALSPLTPAPLSHTAVSEVLRDLTDRAVDEALADRVHEDTGGNPFLVTELARQLESGTGVTLSDDDGALAPESVSRSILRRLRRLGPGAAGLSEAMVALGDGCTLDEACDLAGISPDDGTAAASLMMRAEILRHAETLGFVHPLVRAAVEHQITPVTLTAAHGRAAALLLRRGARRDRVVAQLLKSGALHSHEAAEALRESGREGMAMGAPATAALYLRRALQEGTDDDDHGDVSAELGLALLLSGSSHAAIPVLRRSYERSVDATKLAARGRMIWLAFVNIGAIEEGVQLLRDTIERIGDDDREARLMLEADFVTAGTLDARRLGDAWERLAPFEDLPGATPAERRVLAVVTTHQLHSPSAEAAEIAEIALRAAGNGELVRENAMDATQWVWGIGTFILTDRLEAAEADLELAVEAAHASGSLEALTIAYDLRAWLRLRQGRLADAEADVLNALARLADVAATPLRELIQIGSIRAGVRALVARGRIADADRLLVDHGLDGPLPAELRHAKLSFERGLLRLAQGRIEEALADASAIEAFNVAHALEDVPDAPWRLIAATGRALLGDTAAAVSLAERQLELARGWGLPRDIGIALRIRAIAETDSGVRIELLEQALLVLEDAPASLEVAETQADLGRALLRDGRRSDARQPLADALEGASRCGAFGLVERITTDLRVAGARPRRIMRSGIDALTPAERRTAEMAAMSLSNREIAQRLYLSVRTVENTLRRVYHKLGIPSREHLNGALAGSLGSTD